MYQSWEWPRQAPSPQLDTASLHQAAVALNCDYKSLDFISIYVVHLLVICVLR